jgi:DNA-binding NtrC family response regulator
MTDFRSPHQDTNLVLSSDPRPGHSRHTQVGHSQEVARAGNVRELQNLIERAVILTQGSELYAGLES